MLKLLNKLQELPLNNKHFTQEKQVVLLKEAVHGQYGDV
jgi:hypothetical protein